MSDSSSGEITAAFVNVTDVFTQYTEIPSSGFNVLYKAQRYGKWFVLKGLKPEFRNSAVHLQLLKKEFELGIQMSHPNIVQYFSKEVVPLVGDCIVMEYVDGVTLSEYLQKRRAKRDDKIALQLLRAMAYYHNLQIVHRDLKPENILISRNGNNVKIIDFGLGDCDTSAILKQPAGSPKYIAPEQRRCDVKIDARADLYSFALILKQLSLSRKWSGVRRACGYEERDKRPIDAGAALALLSRSRSRNISLSAAGVLALLVVGIMISLRFVPSTEPKPVSGDRKNLAAQHDTIVVTDTFQQQGVTKIDTFWNDLSPAEITTEMKEFLNVACIQYWQPMEDLIAQNQGRIDELANGVKSDIDQDEQLYDKFLKKYEDLAYGSVEYQKKLCQLLKEKFPAAQRIATADIYLCYIEFNSPFVAKYAVLLNKISHGIGHTSAQ